MARNKSMKEQLEGIAISVAPIVSKEKKRESKQEGGDVDNQMTIMMSKPMESVPMKSDEQMEDDFIDFVVNSALSSAEQNTLGILVDGYQEASDALHEFANAREELFYGFSSDNLTGNLVKQVVQQGVETLISTTEVVMTNNFNGMTTTEVANQILDKIESGGNHRGILFGSS